MLKNGKKVDKAYEGFVQAAGEDGDTERRHFSSLPGNQYQSASQQPGHLNMSSAENNR